MFGVCWLITFNYLACGKLKNPKPSDATTHALDPPQPRTEYLSRVALRGTAEHR